MQRLIDTFYVRIRQFFAASFGDALEDNDHFSANTKIGCRSLLTQYRQDPLVCKGNQISSLYGVRIFSQTDEDGIILYLLSKGVLKTQVFIEIGATDGVGGSNCANLAINLGWQGIFIDKDEGPIAKAMDFYSSSADTKLAPPQCLAKKVNVENINQVLQEAEITGEIDVLSIDIDGNDYWVWQAIKVISPRLVIIEARIEWGNVARVMDYKKNYAYTALQKDSFGASIPALIKLGKKLGYKLVCTNRLGYNLFFVRQDIKSKYVHQITYPDIEQAISHIRRKGHR